MLGPRGELTQAPWPPMHVRTRNSVAYRIVLVADGSANATVGLLQAGLGSGGGDIILTEAGGRLTDTGGATPIYNRPATLQPSLAVANHLLHAKIISLLNGRAASGPDRSGRFAVAPLRQ